MQVVKIFDIFLSFAFAKYQKVVLSKLTFLNLLYWFTQA